MKRLADLDLDLDMAITELDFRVTPTADDAALAKQKTSYPALMEVKVAHG